MRFFRGYDPRNDELITKVMKFAKEIVLEYYDEKARGKPPRVRAFTDIERAKIQKEIDETLEFVLDKSHITEIDNDLWRFIDDRVMSSLTVYREYIKYESEGLESKELDAELDAIDKIFEYKDQEPESDYNIYLRLYEELKNIRKLSDIQ